MNDPAGKLLIRVAPSGVQIGSSRPVHAAGVFAGRGVEETAGLLPALFSICSTAQAAACTGALEQAMGHVRVPSVDRLRRRLVDAETLREHLWRILLDWPRGVGASPDGPAMARVMAGFAALKQAVTAGADPFHLAACAVEPDGTAAGRAEADLAALATERVLGEAPHVWLSKVASLADLREWTRRADTAAAQLLAQLMAKVPMDLGRSSIEALPALDAVSLESRLAGDGANGFVARPEWSGSPRETSPYSRNLDAALVRDLTERFGNGLLTRLVAQLVEVARLAMWVPGAGGHPRGPGSASSGLAPGIGLTQVSAARGLLVHRVQVSGLRVKDYRIVAPTEWNFHPRGAVALGLAGMSLAVAPADLEPLARLFINAVDPCVDFVLDVSG